MANRPNILFVDDEYNPMYEDDPTEYPNFEGVIMSIIRRLREDYDVTGVASCDDALEILMKSENQFSLIILDLQMNRDSAGNDFRYQGRLSGVVFAETIRNKHSIKLPIIIYTVLSKNGTADLWGRLSKVGIRDEDFIPKGHAKDPFRDTFPDLKEAVDRYLRPLLTGQIR